MLYLRVWHRIMVFVLQLDSFSPARRRSHDQCEALSEGEIELDLAGLRRLHTSSPLYGVRAFVYVYCLCLCFCVCIEYIYVCIITQLKYGYEGYRQFPLPRAQVYFQRRIRGK